MRIYRKMARREREREKGKVVKLKVKVFNMPFKIVRSLFLSLISLSKQSLKKQGAKVVCGLQQKSICPGESNWRWHSGAKQPRIGT